MRFVWGFVNDENVDNWEKVLAIEDDDDFFDDHKEGTVKYRMELGYGLPFAFENTYYKLKESGGYPEKKKLENALKYIKSGTAFHDGTGRFMETFKRHPNRFMYEADSIICYLSKDESKELIEFIVYLMQNGFCGFLQASESPKSWFLVNLPPSDSGDYNEEVKKRNSFLAEEEINMDKVHKIETDVLGDLEKFIKNYENGDFIFGHLD